MSQEGIKLFANVLSIIQEERNKLLAMSTKFHDMSSKSSKQDLRLAHLLDYAKDAVKDKFCKITMEKV